MKRRPRIVMTMCVRDEGDVLETQLAFHFAMGVDFVIAIDNRSQDDTPAILQRHADAGRLLVQVEDREDFPQWEWVTRMARLAATEFGADWVLHSDGDEFWWPHAADLKAALGSIPRRYGLGSAFRVNFVPVADESGPFHQRLVVRERISRNDYGDLLPGKILHRPDRNIRLKPGNHDADATALRRLRDWPPITILHYPIRGWEQYRRKVANMGSARKAHPMMRARGNSWIDLYELMRAGRLRETYERRLLTPEARERGLATRRLVRDPRLRDFLAAQRG